MPPLHEPLGPRSEHGILPIPPIEAPSGWFTRMLFRATARRYGRTPTAFRVLYARSPGIALVSFAIVTVIGLFLRIPPRLRFLVQVKVAMQNECTFCADLQLAEAVMAKVDRARFRALPDFESSPHFDPAEKAALAFVAAHHDSFRIDDATWARLRAHFDERACVELVFLCAVETHGPAAAHRQRRTRGLGPARRPRRRPQVTIRPTTKPTKATASRASVTFAAGSSQLSSSFTFSVRSRRAR